MGLPRSGDELARIVIEHWRWFVYRARFHRWVTQVLPQIFATLFDYLKLMRLDRPIGIWLLLWPTLWALWIAAKGKPDAHIFMIFVAGVVLMRSAGCVFNDYADRGFDRYVERTKDRPLAAGRVSGAEALVLFFILGLSALVLAMHLNQLALLLAVAGAFLAIAYPFIKRFLPVPQLFLGLAFGWGIPMAFAAQLERLPRIAWLVFIANLLWVTAYDTQYAMVDRDDDLNIGVKSTAILFGDSDRHIVAVLQLLTVVSLVLVGRMAALGPWYWAGLLVAAVLFAYQLWLIHGREREACFRAFLNNNYAGMAVFVGILFNYIFK